MNIQEYHIIFNLEKSENFFRNLKRLIKSFKSDVDIYITEDAMEKMKKMTRKKVFENDEIEKLTFKIELDKKTNMVDIIIDKETKKVKELGFGPINHKRTTYHPYKQKEASRKFYIV